MKMKKQLLVLLIGLSLFIPSVAGINCQPVVKHIPVVVDMSLKVNYVSKDYYVFMITTKLTTKNVLYTIAKRYPNKVYMWRLYEDGRLKKRGYGRLQYGYYPINVFLARAKGIKLIDVHPSNPNVLDPVRKYTVTVKFYPRYCDARSDDAYYKLPQSDSATKWIRVYP